MRVAFLASLLSLAGCHSWALESQCHRLQVGTPLSVAYRTVTVAPPQCLYRPTQGRFSEERVCGAYSAGLLYVQWTHRVFGGTTPDVCRAHVDEKGQVTHVHYQQGPLGD
jgi:hypothetical protein